MNPKGGVKLTSIVACAVVLVIQGNGGLLPSKKKRGGQCGGGSPRGIGGCENDRRWLRTEGYVR